MKKLLALAVAIIGFSALSFGQTLTVTKQGTATATILAGLELTSKANLSFGTIGALSGSASTVTISTLGVRSGTATPYALGVAPAAAQFEIKGTPDAYYTLTLPSTITKLDGPTGSTPMTIAVTSWSQDQGTTPRISSTGTTLLHLGATLDVADSQKAGDYSGTFDVTVAYN